MLVHRGRRARHPPGAGRRGRGRSRDRGGGRRAAARPRRGDRPARRLSAQGPDRAARRDRPCCPRLRVQLAVAVQNARLHEETTRLAPSSRRRSSPSASARRELRSLYEISRFVRGRPHARRARSTRWCARSSSLLGVDAAVIRMLDGAATSSCPRRPRLGLGSSRVRRDAGAAAAARQAPRQALLRAGNARSCSTRDVHRNLGADHELSCPFLDHGIDMLRSCRWRRRPSCSRR